MPPLFRKNRILIGIFILAAMALVAIFTIPNTKTLIINGDVPSPANSSLKGALNSQTPKKTIEFGPPEISGWIAWWEEDDGFNVVEKYRENLSCISPGWFKLNKDGNLVETGKLDKSSASQKIRDAHLKLFPMLTTDLTDQQFSVFTKNERALNSFIENLTSKLKDYHADGLDLDFENIGSPYTADFSYFIKTLGENLKKNNFKFSVVVQAQTGHNDWEGLKGQDLTLISQYADEVRIMIYDRHGEFSDPGPITPMDWYVEVLNYNLKLIPRDKIVIGLPTYGYIWQEDGSFESLQFKDFIAFAENKFEVSRDPASFELKYTKNKSTGWLSDSAAVIRKMDYARKIGLNRFVVWNLGGTDEELFNAKWENISVNAETTNP